MCQGVYGLLSGWMWVCVGITYSVTLWRDVPHGLGASERLVLWLHEPFSRHWIIFYLGRTAVLLFLVPFDHIREKFSLITVQKY